MYSDYTYNVIVSDRIAELHAAADQARLARQARSGEPSWGERMRRLTGRALRPTAPLRASAVS